MNITRTLAGTLVAGSLISAVAIGNYYWKEHQINKTVSSFTDAIVNDLEDGTLDSIVTGDYCTGSFFIEAQATSDLDLSATTKDEAQKSITERSILYEQSLDTIIDGLRTFEDFSQWSNIERWDYVFRSIQQNILVNYEEECFDVGTTLENGCYNCNSSAQLFASALFDLDKLGYLDAKPLRFIQFGDKKAGHVILGYSYSSGRIVKYYENTNPDNFQDPRYKYGKVLTIEEFVSGYLFGMAVDAPSTRSLLEPSVVQDLRQRLRSTPADIQVDTATEQTIVNIHDSRKNLRHDNNSQEKKYVFDPFIFPPMGYDLEITDSNDVNYLERAEVWLALGDFSRAQYLADVAYNRGQITDELYDKFEKTIDAVIADPHYSEDLCIDPQRHDRDFGFAESHQKILSQFVEDGYYYGGHTRTVPTSLWLLSKFLSIAGYGDIGLTVLTEFTQNIDANPADVQVAYQDMATLLLDQGFYGDALDAEFTVRNFHAQGISSKYVGDLASNSFKIGSIYGEIGNSSEAQKYLLEAEQTMTEKTDPIAPDNFLFNIAQQFYDIHDFENAERVLTTKVLPTPLNKGYFNGDVYVLLGQVYIGEQGNLWQVKDATKARDAYETALAIAEKDGDRLTLRKAHYALSVIYSSNQQLYDSEKAEQHFQRYKDFKWIPVHSRSQ